MKRCLVLTASCLLVLLIGVGTVGSQDGRGLVIMSSPISTIEADPINYSFPRLFRYDSMRGTLIGAAADNLALTLSPQPTADLFQTIQLREDLLWEDGRAVNAWDVLAALITYGFYLDTLSGIKVIDDSTLSLGYRSSACSNLAQINPIIAPVSARFEAFARDFNSNHDEVIPIGDWQLALRDSGVEVQTQFRNIELVNGFGDRRTISLSGASGTRLGNLALLYIPGSSSVDAFLRGQTNLLIDPAFNRRTELLSQEVTQVYDAPGRWLHYLVFNMADTRIPRSAFTRRGELLEQGVNQFFSDRRVRQAVQLGLDISAIIDIFYHGGASVATGTIPSIWQGHNPAIEPASYDPGAAARLLDEAGWVDTDGDGIRNCYRCLYAEPGTSLSLRMESSIAASDLIRTHLRRIGIEVNIGSGAYTGQDSDLYLIAPDADYVYVQSPDPDQSAALTRAGDVIGSMGNLGSYYNPEVERLMEQARTLSGCDITERAALYRQAQAIIADDIAIIGLFTLHDFYLARGIDGFDPRPGDPFWNLPNWRVTR